MYQPTNGDTVTVNRTTRGGRTWTWTGVLSEVLDPRDTESGIGGFRLTGTGPDGQSDDTNLADSSSMQRLYGVTQTIKLVSAVTR